MSLLILRTATRYLVPLLLLFSLFLLVRGHHEPGGGFVGGLVGATAVVLIGLAEGPRLAREFLRVPSQLLVPIGLAISAVAGLLPLSFGLPFLTGIWAGEGSSLGSPLLFDLGVYLTVTGVVVSILLALMEET